jgi:hypothetical protein
VALKEKLSKGEVFSAEELIWFNDLYEACVDAEEKRDWYRYKLEKNDGWLKTLCKDCRKGSSENVV